MPLLQPLPNGQGGGECGHDASCLQALPQIAAPFLCAVRAPRKSWFPLPIATHPSPHHTRPLHPHALLCPPPLSLSPPMFNPQPLNPSHTGECLHHQAQPAVPWTADGGGGGGGRTQRAGRLAPGRRLLLHHAAHGRPPLPIMNTPPTMCCCGGATALCVSPCLLAHQVPHTVSPTPP